MTDNLRGALWILLGATCASGMTLSVRGLAGDVPTIEIVFVRCVIGLVIVVPLVVWRLRGHDLFARWRLQLVRALLGLGALFCGFHALTLLPVATATVLFFTAPLWVTVLAIPLFGERVGWRRGLATAAGFAGAIVVIRPTPDTFETTMLWPLASSVLFAGVLLLGKKLSQTETPLSMMLMSMVVATAGSAPGAVSQWVAPGPEEWLLLLSVALFGTLRNYSDIRGYAAGEASLMAPFQYTRIVIVAIVAYVLFAEVPDAPTIAGAAIIVASTLYIAQREAQLARRGVRSARGGAAAP